MKLTETLREYHSKQYISFHTPGHKGRIENKEMSILDVTELEETDNLFHPSGVLLDSQKELAASLGCEQAIFLPNGATSGNLAVFFSLFREGDRVIVDRNCHISVIHALVLSGVIPIFTDGEISGEFEIPVPIKAKNVKDILENNEGIKGIFVTSPNYFGLMADIKSISHLAAQYRIPLIVDEAHGTHLYYSKNGEKSAMKNGANIAVLSLHKNLPVLTQCGCIVYNNSGFDMIKQGVKYFTSTSPSYLLMSSMDTLSEKMDHSGRKCLDEITKYTQEIRKKIREIPNLMLLDEPDSDQTRVVINIKKCNVDMMEFEAYLKEKFHIVCEMTSGKNIVFIISMCNTKAELDLLYEGLKTASDHFGTANVAALQKKNKIFVSQLAVSPKQAHFAGKKTVSLSEAEGCIAGENVICFPPSIPLIVLGERVTAERIEKIKEYTGRKEMLVLIQESENAV